VVVTGRNKKERWSYVQGDTRLGMSYWKGLGKINFNMIGLEAKRNCFVSCFSDQVNKDLFMVHFLQVPNKERLTLGIM
jgi:CRISPR/Cas system CSM-associated protein Csm3 (group 7 of RAMP superfamily)